MKRILLETLCAMAILVFLASLHGRVSSLKENTEEVSELRDLVTTAARSCGKLRTVGWDVVLAPDGPILLEANQKWDADLTQMHWPMRNTPLGREAVAYLRAGRVPG